MRHLTGFLLALAVLAALFFGAGLGVWRFGGLHGAGPGLALHSLTNRANYVPVAALIGTALLVGIMVAAPRVSPIGPGLPGLILLGWSALVLLHAGQALSYVPLAGSHYAAGFTAMLGSGVLALLGAALIVPMFMPSRWRRVEVELDEFDSRDLDMPTAIGMMP